MSNRPQTGELRTLIDDLWSELLGTESGAARNARTSGVPAVTGDIGRAEGSFLGKRRGLIRLTESGGALVAELNGRTVALEHRRPGVLVGIDPQGGGALSVGMI
jgi:hypothetical protein